MKYRVTSEGYDVVVKRLRDGSTIVFTIVEIEEEMKNTGLKDSRLGVITRDMRRAALKLAEHAPKYSWG